MPDMSGLVTTSVLNRKVGEVENKHPAVSGLVKKAKILEIEGKYFTTFDYNTCMIDILDGKIKQKEIVTKSDISNLMKKSDLNTKLRTLATKAELKVEQDKIVELQAFDSSYFHGKCLFFGNQQTPDTLELGNDKGTDYVLSWKSRVVLPYIVYELNAWPNHPTYNFKSKNCFLGAPNMVKNKWVYRGYKIAFDAAGS